MECCLVQVIHSSDFEDEEVLELGNYEAVSEINNSIKSDVANDGMTPLAHYKNNCTLLVPERSDEQVLPAFRPHRKEESRES